MTKNKPTSYQDAHALQLALSSFNNQLSTTTQGDDAALRRAKRFAKFLARSNQPEDSSVGQTEHTKENLEVAWPAPQNEQTHIDGWNAALDAVLNLPAKFGVTQESEVPVSRVTAEIEKLRR